MGNQTRWKAIAQRVAAPKILATLLFLALYVCYGGRTSRALELRGTQALAAAVQVWKPATLPPRTAAVVPGATGHLAVEMRNKSTTPTTPTLVQLDRYLAYSPHSNYHNQRISLENALALAFCLNRTLLVPPIYFTAMAWPPYERILHRLKILNDVSLRACRAFKDERRDAPVVPKVCKEWYESDTMAWGELVDLDKIQSKVQLQERSNLTDEWLEDKLGVTPSDMYELKDSSLYQYRFYDTAEDTKPLTGFTQRINIDQLARDSQDYRLLRVGTLFGTLRLRLRGDENRHVRTTIRAAMVVQHAVVTSITETIRDSMGGMGHYQAVHLRVGNGHFRVGRRMNMAMVWDTLCQYKMEMSRSICEDFKKRSGLSGGLDPIPARGSHSRGQQKHLAALALRDPRPTHTSTRLSITCQRPLHTSTSLVAFNTPLFISTDSRAPRNDSALAVFFAAFPCAFVLSDFSDRIPELDNLIQASHPSQQLHHFLYAQIDGMVAASGRDLVGTSKSTFSQFLTDVLHRVLQGWPIIERGQP